MIELKGVEEVKAKGDPVRVMKRGIAQMHKYSVSVNTVTWTSGDNREVYRKLWDVGFDHFTTDYPYVLFDVVDEIRKGSN